MDPNNANAPAVMKTSTFSRSDIEKKGCFRDAGFWVSGPTKKRICHINRYDYKYQLKEPVYPCRLDRYRGVYGPITPGGCRPDATNGTKGR